MTHSTWGHHLNKFGSTQVPDAVYPNPVLFSDECIDKVLRRLDNSSKGCFFFVFFLKSAVNFCHTLYLLPVRLCGYDSAKLRHINISIIGTSEAFTRYIMIDLQENGSK